MDGSNANYDQDSLIDPLFAPPVAPAPQQTSRMAEIHRTQPTKSSEQHLEAAADRQIEEYRPSKRSKTVKPSNVDPRRSLQPRQIPPLQPNAPGTGIKRRRSSVRLYDIPEFRPNVPAPANDIVRQGNPASDPNTGPRPPHVPANSGNIDFGFGLDILYPFLIELPIYYANDPTLHTFKRIRRDNFGLYAVIDPQYKAAPQSPDMQIIQLKLTATWSDLDEAIFQVVPFRDRNKVPQSYGTCHPVCPRALFVFWTGIGCPRVGQTYMYPNDNVALLKTLDMMKLRGFKDHFGMVFQKL